MQFLRSLVLLVAFTGCAGTVHGVVFLDRNHDGVRQADEPGLAGIRVGLDHQAYAVTDKDGRFSFVAMQPASFAWAHVPDGYRPGPAFARADGTSDIALQQLSAKELARPLTFVVAADTHTATQRPDDPWDGGDIEDTIAQALALPEPPRFFTIVGDVTQGNKEEQFDRVLSALRSDVPWVPVPGNHDWYDRGETWRAKLGPDNYSFDVGDLRVIVWDTNLPADQQIDFFTRELDGVDPARTIVALGHESPTDAVADQLAALGVDYLFTGHWHANRRVERQGLIEWGTQTMVMGSIDQSPAGYRIVTFVDGIPTIEHRTRMVAPHVALASPHTGSCASPYGFDLLASASLDASTPAVTARIDCGPAMALESRGGWSFGARVELTPGIHGVEITATTPSGRTATTRASFEVCEKIATGRESGEWPQPGGGPAHANATAHAIAPPIAQQWATSVGGNLLLGSPVVANSTVVVNVWDLGGGDRGGVVALDLATGEIKWRHTTPLQTRAAPAISGDTVVIALNNGELQALGLADGALRWTYDASRGLDATASSLWSSPVIANDIVYVGVQGRISALALADGAVVWERELQVPDYAWLGSLAPVTVAGDTAIANVGRWNGMSGWSAGNGTARFNLTNPLTTAINSTPVASSDTLYYANAAGDVTALELATQRQRWTQHVIAAKPDEWLYAITAPLAIAGNRLFVPTQHQDLVVLDTSTGAELWRASTPAGPLSFAHYRGAEAGFAAGVVVTGEIVWVPRPDGVLAALAVADGHELWSTQLGAPVVSAPAPAGDMLVVATFDGTVRAFAAANVRPTPDPPAACPGEPPSGDADPTMAEAGCCSGAPGMPSLALSIGVALVLRRRRR